jgi:hypothetical protein
MLDSSAEKRKVYGQNLHWLSVQVGCQKTIPAMSRTILTGKHRTGRSICFKFVIDEARKATNQQDRPFEEEANEDGTAGLAPRWYMD